MPPGGLPRFKLDQACRQIRNERVLSRLIGRLSKRRLAHFSLFPVSVKGTNGGNGRSNFPSTMPDLGVGPGTSGGAIFAP
jgi:hypothetical protein